MDRNSKFYAIWIFLCIIITSCEKESTEPTVNNEPIEITFVIKKLDHLGHYMAASYCDIEAGFSANSGFGNLNGKADSNGKLKKAFTTDGYPAGVWVTRVWYYEIEYRPTQETLYVNPGDSKSYIIYLD